MWPFNNFAATPSTAMLTPIQASLFSFLETPQCIGAHASIGASSRVARVDHRA
jgi:hypothetical protein